MNEHNTFDELHQLGIKAWDNQNYSEAALYLVKAREIDPEHIQNLITLSCVYRDLQQFEESIEVLDLVEKLSGNDNPVLALRGKLAFEQGQTKNAIGFYKRQIELNPNFEQTRHWLCEAYKKLKIEDSSYRPQLSACFIVKNEEDCLGQALANVSPHVEEIIVVDTGSTDDTVKIAEKYNSKVHQIEWRNDFSWARNQSLKHATQEWVIVLDADEMISDEDWKKIKELIFRKDADEAFLIQTTYTDRSLLFNWKINDLNVPESEGYSGYFESPLVRLFRNSPDIYFQGAVHENIKIINPQYKALTPPIRIHHYGKSRSEERMNEKSELYYQIGKKKLDEMPNNSHAVYEMAVQLWEMDRREEAEQYFEKAIEMDPGHENAGILYGCYLHQNGRYGESLENFIRVIENNPNNSEVHFYVSSVLIDLKKFDFALEMLRKAQELGFNNEVSILVNQGVIYANLKMYDEAAAAYDKALSINDKAIMALTNYIVLERERGNNEAAIKHIKTIFSIGQGVVYAHKYYGEVLFEEGKHDEALEQFLLAHESCHYEETVIGQVIIAAHLLDKESVVKEFEKKLVEFSMSPNFKNILKKLESVYEMRKDKAGLKRLAQMVQQLQPGKQRGDQLA